MKKNFSLSVFIIIFLNFFLPKLNAESQSPPPQTQAAPQTQATSDTPGTISMDFKDADLKDVLKVFSMQSGMNFMSSEAVQDRKITLYLDKVPVGKAMDKLFKANNLSYDLDQEANIFLVKDWGKPEIETVTQVFYLKYATVSTSSIKEEMSQNFSAQGTGGGALKGAQEGKTEEKGKWAVEQNAGITKAIKNILSKNGTLMEDFRTNSLIVTDMPSRMPMIAQTIAALDVPMPQIILEVEMMDVSRNTLEKIGLKFGDISDFPNIFTATYSGPTRSTNFPLAAYSKGAVSTFSQGSLSFLANPPFTAYLNFIRAQTDTKYLARPKLMTMNNEPAEIKITTQEVIGETITYTDEGRVQVRSSERMETGVSLRVTAQVNSELNEITMFIVPRVAEANVSPFSNNYRDPEQRETKSLVKAKDGETIIIGGLIRNESSETVTKLPILGDLPFVGRLFSHKNKEKGRERELIVFITPHIVKDTAIGLARAKEAVSLEREQDAIPAINRDALMGDYLNNCDKKVIE